MKFRDRLYICEYGHVHMISFLSTPFGKIPVNRQFNNVEEYEEFCRCLLLSPKELKKRKRFKCMTHDLPFRVENTVNTSSTNITVRKVQQDNPSIPDVFLKSDIDTSGY